MVELDRLFKTKVKNKGVFDFKESYRVLYDWFMEQGYVLNEKSYKETVGPGGEKEIEIEWLALRQISDYFRFRMEVKWHIIGMKDAEVEIDGVKRKMNSGLFEVGFESILEKDYEHRWEKNPFLKFLRTLYDRYLIQSRIEGYEGKLLTEMDDLIAETKAFLSLSSQ
jgi:hypothetical protein